MNVIHAKRGTGPFSDGPVPLLAIPRCGAQESGGQAALPILLIPSGIWRQEQHVASSLFLREGAVHGDGIHQSLGTADAVAALKESCPRHKMGNRRFFGG